MTSYLRWTIAWLLLCLVLALHIYEEATRGSYLAYDLVRRLFPWLPPFHFEIWLLNVGGAVVVLVGLTWFVHKRLPIMRLASYALAIFATGNAMLHLLLSLAWNQALIGMFTSPLLLAASLFLFVSIPRSEAEYVSDPTSPTLN